MIQAPMFSQLTQNAYLEAGVGVGLLFNLWYTFTPTKPGILNSITLYLYGDGTDVYPLDISIRSTRDGAELTSLSVANDVVRPAGPYTFTLPDLEVSAQEYGVHLSVGGSWYVYYCNEDSISGNLFQYEDWNPREWHTEAWELYCVISGLVERDETVSPLTDVQIVATDRAGEDHDLTHLIDNDYSVSSSMPGGCDLLVANLKRPLGRRYVDTDLLNEIELWDPEFSATQPLYSGKVRSGGREIGASEAVQITAVGAFGDDMKRAKYRQIFKDNDYSKFIYTRDDSASHFSVDNNNRLFYQIQAGHAYAQDEFACYRYRIQGSEKITRVAFTYNSFMGSTLSQLIDGSSGGNVFTNTATGAVSGTQSIPVNSGSGAAYLNFYMHVDTAIPTSNQYERWCEFSNVVIYGTSGGATGVTSDAIIRGLVPLVPGLNSDTSHIATGSVALDHFAIRSPMEVAQIVEEANTYAGWDVAVWGDRKLYYDQRPATGTVDYYCRLDLGAKYNWATEITDERPVDTASIPYTSNDSAEYDYNDLVATATGTSVELDAASESAGVVLEAPTPYTRTRRKIQGRWVYGPRTAAQAAQVGTAYFSEQKATERSPNGSLSLPEGSVFDADGTPVNPRLIGARGAGCNIQILDLLPADDAFDSFDERTIGRIAHAEYSGADKTCVCTLDPSDMSYEALMARLAAAYHEPLAPLILRYRWVYGAWHWHRKRGHRYRHRHRARRPVYAPGRGPT